MVLWMIKKKVKDTICLQQSKMFILYINSRIISLIIVFELILNIHKAIIMLEKLTKKHLYQLYLINNKYDNELKKQNFEYLFTL